MTAKTIARHMAAIVTRMEDNDFTTPAEDSAMRRALAIVNATDHAMGALKMAASEEATHMTHPASVVCSTCAARRAYCAFLAVLA